METGLLALESMESRVVSQDLPYGPPCHRPSLLITRLDCISSPPSCQNLAQLLHNIIMDTRKQDTPLYIGTFQNAKEVNIDCGNFTINHHNAIKQESNTDISAPVLFIHQSSMDSAQLTPAKDIRELYKYISTAVLHSSRERAQEVPETELKNIAHEWSSHLRTLPTTISTPTESSVPLSSPFD